MAKERKRGNNEVKKPKQPKKAASAPSVGFDKGINPTAGLGSKKKA